jgi:Tfp pilus assembly protein PilO
VTTRDRSILLVVAALAVVAGFWFMAIRPKRTEGKALDAQVATQRQRLETAETTLAAGVQAKAEYPRNVATVVQLGKAIPSDEDVPSLLYQIQSVSHGAKVRFDSIERAAAAASTSSSSSSSAATPSSTGAATATLPPGTAVGSAGLATAPFTLRFSGSFFALQRFVGDVQRFVHASGGTITVGGRLLSIDGVSLTASDTDLSHLKAMISATAYLSPENAAAATSGTTSTTTPGATGDSSSSTAPAPTSTAITGGTS